MHDTYVRNVMLAIIAILPHFLLSFQFIGFWGSSGPSQSTTFESGNGCSVKTSALPLLPDDELCLRPDSRSTSFSRSELAGDVSTSIAVSFSCRVVDGNDFLSGVFEDCTSGDIVEVDVGGGCDGLSTPSEDGVP